MTEEARKQRDVTTVRFERDVDIDSLLEASNALHINMGISSILGTRKNQQDTVFGAVDGNRAIAVVCDGMGGMNGGELASQTAATILIDDYYNTTITDMREFFQKEAKKMDQAVNNLKNEDGRPLNGGTTVVAVVIENNKMYFLSVGDSKIYILRDNEILAVNREHNYRLSLDEKLKKGQITKEQYIAEEDQAEALISYLGMGNVSLMDINNEPFILQENDIVLLCSDGLYKRLPDKDIMQIIQLEECNFLICFLVDSLQSDLKSKPSIKFNGCFYIICRNSHMLNSI